jgi:hypothetical protein
LGEFDGVGVLAPEFQGFALQAKPSLDFHGPALS